MCLFAAWNEKFKKKLTKSQHRQLTAPSIEFFFLNHMKKNLHKITFLSFVPK